jgi:adenylate kinase family enzyme
VSTPGLGRRILVVGPSGSGKTTLASRLAETCALDHIELDSLFHLPGWTELPVEELRRVVTERTSGDGWVVDGNYQAVAGITTARADTIVWIDLGRLTTMARLLRRSIRRVVTRAELWNGNRESVWNLLSRDPEQNLLLWTWQRHELYRARYELRAFDDRWAHATVIRLRSQVEIDDLLRRAGGTL